MILPVLCIFVFTCQSEKKTTIYDGDRLPESMYLQDWLLLGPFPNCDTCREESFRHDERCLGFFSDFLKAEGGEKNCQPAAGGKVTISDKTDIRLWTFYHSETKEIDLGKLFTPSEQRVVYAYCAISSSNEQQRALTLGSNDGVQVFFNGERIHIAHPPEGRGVRSDDDFLTLTFRKGINHLLLKIENGYGDFGFIARLIDLESPLADLLKTQGQPITLSAGDIQAVFIDNYAFDPNHRAGYNGLAELRHRAQDSTLFVPSYAGFNLEHIFSSDSLQQLFEPRRNPLSLKKISDSEVLLHQPATPLSHIESWTLFQLTPPYYIDVSFRCVIHSKEFFKNDLAGLFWASYINAPADKKIYFWGREKQTADYRWIGAYSPRHGLQSTHIAETDTLVLYTTPGFNVVLANHLSDYVFQEPFYFGRFHSMVFAYLFDTHDDQVIRFSQSPTGGGDTNPAWDFQFLIPDFEVDREYGFKCRLVYKKFIDAEDIRHEFKQWRKNLNRTIPGTKKQ
jgi:hypothetical protein